MDSGMISNTREERALAHREKVVARHAAVAAALNGKSLKLSNKSHRDGLPPKREPYWMSLGRGRYLGFRKLANGTGTWLGKWRDRETGKRSHEALGSDINVTFDMAKEAAETFFNNCAKGITTGDTYTMAMACEAYVAELREGGRDVAAHDAHMRFTRTVYGKPFGVRAVARLRVSDYKSWRAGLGLKHASSNRTLTALKAALNLSVLNRKVPVAAAQEWRDVKPHPIDKEKQRRKLFLDIKQRRQLLAACAGALKNLVAATIHTGCRAGELVSARCSAFNPRERVLSVNGKTGARDVALSPAATKLFAGLVKGRAAGDFLLVRDDGRHWSHSDWDELIREAAAKAGLPTGAGGVCLYSLRHSWITEAVKSDKLSTAEVAEIAGTSLQMIETFYCQKTVKRTRERLAKVVMI